MEPNQEKKTIKSPVVIALIVLIIALGSVVAYLYLKPIKTETKLTGETSDQTVQVETQAGTQPGSTPTATVVKADIDKDVQSLDTLNLSGVENDYGEDNLNDL